CSPARLHPGWWRHLWSRDRNSFVGVRVRAFPQFHGALELDSPGARHPPRRPLGAAENSLFLLEAVRRRHGALFLERSPRVHTHGDPTPDVPCSSFSFRVVSFPYLIDVAIAKSTSQES